MQKAPAGLLQKKESRAVEPLKKAIIFLTPLRTIQLLGFLLAFILALHFQAHQTFRSVDEPFFDPFLKFQASPRVHPAIVYIGIEKKSGQDLPFSQRHKAEMIQALRAWGAKAIVFDLFFKQTGENSEDDRFLIEEFQKTDNIYLSVSFAGSGRAGGAFLPAGSDPVFNDRAKAVGHVDIEQDPDHVVRRLRPFIQSDQKPIPYLGLKVAYDFLGSPISLEKKNGLTCGKDGSIPIRWTQTRDTTPRYYSSEELVRSYALSLEGKTAPVRPDDIRGKICLIGLMDSGLMATPLENASSGIGVLGNIVNMALTDQYIQTLCPWPFAALLFFFAVASGFALIPYRGAPSILAVFGIAGMWVLTAFILFSWMGLWAGITAPVLMIAAFFLISFTIARVEEYRERMHFLSLAAQDELTGLYLMRYVSTFLERAINYARTFRKPFAVLLIDFDDFRPLNETYGYRTGDGVLQRVAGVVQGAIHTQAHPIPDIAGRFSEDQFIVLLSSCNLAAATFGVAEKIRKAVEELVFEVGDKKFHTTISLGVSILKPGEKNSEKIMARARQALLKAKTTGKNQTCIQND